MTAENGLGNITIHSQAINSADFIDFLSKLRSKYAKCSIVLFMD